MKAVRIVLVILGLVVMFFGLVFLIGGRQDTGILMLREIDERFNITSPLGDCMDDRS